MLVFVLSGCALSVSDPRARLPMQGFTTLESDARVQVEPGFEAYGARVAAALPAAVRDVEAAHYRAFAYAPVVHVCGTPECFKRWVKTPKLSAAVIPDNRLILSPNLDGRERFRLPGLLRHELAHLHLGQRIGHYHSTLPVWFHEGWASLTAGGGGTEFATDAEVRADIRGGRRLQFALRDTPDRRHLAAESGLGIHAFYRQAMLAVRWLKVFDEAKFRQLALAVQDNADFEIAFWEVYGQAPATQLRGFFDEAMRDNPALPKSPAAQRAPAP